MTIAIKAVGSPVRSMAQEFPDSRINTKTDSYKQAHDRWLCATKIQKISYYLTARKGGPDGKVALMGVRDLVENLFAGPRHGAAGIQYAEDLYRLHFNNPNAFDGDLHRERAMRNGNTMPVRIKALREGWRVPAGTPLLTIESTDPTDPGLGGRLEDFVLQLYGPGTVAMKARDWKEKIARGLQITTGQQDKGLIDSLVDFGLRSVPGMEAARMLGLGHLANFQSTDNVPSLELGETYCEAMPGYSIAASEHSVTQALMAHLGSEAAAYKFMMDQFPDHPVSLVIDTIDPDKAITDVLGGELREYIQARKALLVVRPDSGCPEDMVLNVFQRLQAAFGTEENHLGYHELPKNLAVLQGDGIDGNAITRIIDKLIAHKFSTRQLIFGSGGGLLSVKRDDLSYAMKAWSVTYPSPDDATLLITHPIQKTCAADAQKASLYGPHKVVRTATGDIELVPQFIKGSGGGDHFTVNPKFADAQDLLRPVFENGKIIQENLTTLQEIRHNMRLGDEWAHKYNLKTEESPFLQAA